MKRTDNSLKEGKVPINDPMSRNPSNTPDGPSPLPWQLHLFRRSLKKQQKVKALLHLLGDVRGLDCLLVTCGDNNGALNWSFRSHGGRWTWADVDGENIDQIQQLLGEAVHRLPPGCFSFPDQSFDCVVSIDVLEHLPQDQPFLMELRRVLKTGGRAVVTVPNGDPRLLANRIKTRVGMTPDIYGHTRAGYSPDELGRTLQMAGLKPVASGGYSRFFTEMVELMINYGYVHGLGKKNNNDKKPGRIAPGTAKELNRHGLAYRIYSLVYPFLRTFIRLDAALPATMDNAVIVVAIKTETNGR